MSYFQNYSLLLFFNSQHIYQKASHLQQSTDFKYSWVNDLYKSTCLGAYIIQKMFAIHLNYFCVLALNWNLQTPDCIGRWPSNF